MSIKANVVANYAGQMWRALMSFALIPVYIRFLGVEAYGLMTIFAMMQAWLTLLDVGMKPALSREMARFTAGTHTAQSIRNLLRSAETIAICIACVVSLAVWGASGWFSTHWLKVDTLPVAVVARAFTLMGIVASFRFVENIYVSTVVGLQRQVADNLISSSIASLRGLGAVAVLAWVSPTIEAFFVWQGLVSLLSLGLYLGFVHRSLPPSPLPARFSTRELANIWRFALGMSTITFLALLLTQVDKILLSRMLPLKLFSYYALAATVANSLYLLIGPITTAFYPRFTELSTRQDSVELAKRYHQAAQFVTVAMGGSAVVLIAFGHRILLLWTGNPDLAGRAAPLLATLTLGTAFNGLMWIPYQLQLAHGWTSLAIKINVAAVGILVPAILWLVPEYGAIAAARVWMVLNAGYLIFLIYFMHLRLLQREKWSWYFTDLTLPLLAAASAGMLLRWVVPNGSSKLVETGYLISSAVLIIGAAAAAAPAVRRTLRDYLPR